MRSFLFLSLLSFLVNLVSSQITTRTHPACGLLRGKVYCFGGAKVVDQNTADDDNVVLVLDLNNVTGLTSTQLMNNWKTVSPDMTNVNYEVRHYPQAIALDDYRFLINGGFSANNRLAAQTITYNAYDNKFYSRLAYTEPPYGERQIYYGAAVNVPGKGIALYGGFESHINTSWVTNATNTSAFSFTDNVTRTIGYVQPVFYDGDNSTNRWTTPLDRMTRQAFFAARLQGIYDPVNQWILYLGGEKRSNNPVNYTQNPIMRPYSEGLAFSTVNNSWIPVALTGDVPPPGRYGFSLTLLPSTNRHVLLYGGDNNNNVFSDYCYILDLDTRKWHQQYIQAPAGTTLARTEHQTVLVNNNTVFVVWGRDANKVGVQDLVMLNVSNPADSITLLTKYSDPNAPTGGDDFNYNDGATNNLSSGAKAGIAVGCIAAGLIGLVLALYYRKKRNERRRRHERQQLESEIEQSPRDHDAVPMEVDWDKIEEKYVELPETNFGTGTSASATMVDDHAAPPHFVHPDGISLDRPNAYDTNHHRPQKPDGFA